MKVFVIIISLLFITSCATVKETPQKDCCKSKTEVTKESCH
jgi:hypothetical protein